MKNIYEKPIIEIVKFDHEDIVTASPFAIVEDSANGNAYESVQKFK